MEYVKAVDGLPFWLKIVLALPFFDWLVYGIYRLCKGNILFGVLWILLGWNIGCIIDIVSLCLYKKVKILA